MPIKQGGSLAISAKSLFRLIVLRNLHLPCSSTPMDTKNIFG